MYIRRTAHIRSVVSDAPLIAVVALSSYMMAGCLAAADTPPPSELDSSQKQSTTPKLNCDPLIECLSWGHGSECVQGENVANNCSGGVCQTLDTCLAWNNPTNCFKDKCGKVPEVGQEALTCWNNKSGFGCFDELRVASGRWSRYLVINSGAAEGGNYSLAVRIAKGQLTVLGDTESENRSASLERCAQSSDHLCATINTGSYKRHFTVSVSPNPPTLSVEETRSGEGYKEPYRATGTLNR